MCVVVPACVVVRPVLICTSPPPLRLSACLSDSVPHHKGPKHGRPNEPDFDFGKFLTALDVQLVARSPQIIVLQSPTGPEVCVCLRVCVCVHCFLCVCVDNALFNLSLFPFPSITL